MMSDRGQRIDVRLGLLAFLALTAVSGCSKEDRNKTAFMSQCAIVSAMRDACTCTYERMMSQVTVEELTAVFEQGKQNARVVNVIGQALAYCKERHR